MAITPPTKFQAIWANDESPTFVTQPIPTGSQPAGRASLNDGFPQSTFTNPNAGGIPPDGRDFNGILFMLTAAAQFSQAGGIYPWDSVFSAAVGGYPSGAVVAHASVVGFFWINSSGGANTTNPDAGGAGWTGFSIANQPATGAQLTFTSTTVLTLAPKAGGFLWINGFNWTVAASPTLSNGALVANTLYYVYAGISAGAIVLTASTTGYTVGTNGIATKSTDPTVTLVGMCQTNPSSTQFQSGLLTRSYWQRPRSAVSSTTFGANHTSVGSAFAEISNTIQNKFLVWAGENVDWSISGGFNGGSTGAAAATGIGFDSTSVAEPGQAIVLGPAGNNFACSIGIRGIKTGLSEGLHFATLLGLTLGGTAQWFGGSTGADVLDIVLNG